MVQIVNRTKLQTNDSVADSSYEPEIVLPVLQIQKKDNFTFVNLTKRMNNQTNCSIALEILRKIWICLVFM